MSKLEENKPAPAAEFAFDNGQNKNLEDFKGKNIVLYFYPKDDTPGCTIEARDFASLMPNFEKLNTVIIGISKDNAKSHNKFREKYCLPFMLASDTDGRSCETYGVLIQKNMFGKKYIGIQRSTFVIDYAGILRKIWYNVSVAGHAEEVLALIKKLVNKMEK